LAVELIKAKISQHTTVHFQEVFAGKQLHWDW